MLDGDAAELLEALSDGIDPAGEKAVGPADDGVSLMQDGRHAKHAIAASTGGTVG